MKPDWTLLFIGGSSGVGKSYLARQLSEHYGLPLVEVGDIKVALQEMLSRIEHPDLFTFIDNPNFRSMTPEEFTTAHLAVSEAMWPALEAVFNKHVKLSERVIFEGGNLLPELLANIHPEKIVGVFLYDDLNEIKRKQQLRARPGNPVKYADQDALFAYEHGQELINQAQKHGFATIKTTPEETVFERLLETISN